MIQFEDRRERFTRQTKLGPCSTLPYGVSSIPHDAVSTRLYRVVFNILGVLGIAKLYGTLLPVPLTTHPFCFVLILIVKGVPLDNLRDKGLVGCVTFPLGSSRLGGAP